MPTAPSPALLERLRNVVGPAGFLDQPADMEPFLTDHRKLFRGVTPLVLRPASTAEIAAILTLCNEAHVGVVPIGGNTGYCGGATVSPDNSQVLLSLQRMRRIRSVDPLNYVLIAEAGCTLAEVQNAATEAGRFFPLSLGSEGSCQIGGNLSTNAGGTAVIRYGMARDLVLGLEVVMPDGRVLDGLKTLRKDNTGYDLRHLFIGAEGTLGIITAAACKLFPAPVSVATAFIGVRDPQAAVELLASLRAASGDNVTTFELLPRAALEMVLEHVPNTTDPLDGQHAWYVLAEVTTSQHVAALSEIVATSLASAMEQGLVTDAALAQNEAQREKLWHIRETVPQAERKCGASIKHDISVPITAIPEFIRSGTRIFHELVPDGRPITFGHLGDGNLHFNVTEPRNTDPGAGRAAFQALAPTVNRAIHDLVQAHRGSISAEHGIGQLKRAELQRYEGEVAIDVMQRIKRALDPNGIMNPGKVVPDL
jgi:FAD/FMN-containing dehydrogenase